MKILFSLLKSLGIFLVLTVFTQIGGLLYLLSKFLFKKITPFFSKKIPIPIQKGLTFLSIYLGFTLFIIPPMAQMNNRVPLPYFAKEQHLQPANILTVLLNRHYVRPKLKRLTEDVSKKMNQRYPGKQLFYLDANFPFWNGFPLLPHLSHNDGRKIDLSFLYKNRQSGDFIHNRLSFTGYGFCEAPQKSERNQPDICAKKGYWQYSLLKQMVNNDAHPEVQFDEIRNKALLKILAKEKVTQKIFIEPHLKNRLQLTNYRKIRYHGCQAVRHDDHIHLQI